MQDFLHELSPTLKFLRKEIHGKTIHIYCESVLEDGKRVHSRVERIVKDINYGCNKVALRILWKKYFDEDPTSGKTTVAETFDFIPPRGRRTKRLDELLLSMQKEMSAIGCERFIKDNIADVSDSTILRILKKTVKVNKR
jgi:hypothetical protein